jgi:hypothetical protein
MNSFIVSIRNNVLEVSSLEDPSELKAVKLDSSVTNGCNINDVALFSENLGQLLVENFEPTKKQSLNFLVEPSEVILNFITDTKKAKNPETYLMTEAGKKLAAFALTPEDVYFSYQKIAPFVYQFVAIKKDILEKYIEVSTTLGLELKSVVPWSLLLPKYTKSSGEPQIFVLNLNNKVALALSELSGIYHLDSFTQENEMTKLKDLIGEFAMFERSDPIKKMFTYNLPGFKLEGDFKTEALGVTDLHTLFAESFNEDLFVTQTNLLTLLPVPVVANKPSALVYAGSAVASSLVIVGAIYGFNLMKTNEVSDTSEVLSETQQVTESTQAEQQESNQEDQGELQEEVVKEEEEVDETAESLDLNREYLRIRIENGTSLAGLAGRTRDHLTPFGYEITNVADSDKSDVETTLVEFTSQTSIYKDVLVADLKEMYGDITVKETLAEGLDYDVLITAGTNESEAQ